MRVTIVIETCMRPSLVFLRIFLIYTYAHTCIFGAYLSVVNSLERKDSSRKSLAVYWWSPRSWCVLGRGVMNSGWHDHNHLLHGYAWSLNRLVPPSWFVMQHWNKHLKVSPSFSNIWLGKLATDRWRTARSPVWTTLWTLGRSCFCGEAKHRRLLFLAMYPLTCLKNT